MGIETFVPVQQEIHQWSDRRKLVETVLLPMMVFVHADPKERMAALTLATVSRYMVLRGEGKPAVIPDDQMARFRFMLDYSEEAICMNYSPLARGKKVRVIKGPLTGLVVVDNSYLPIWWLLVIVIRIEVLKIFFNTSFLKFNNFFSVKGQNIIVINLLEGFS